MARDDYKIGVKKEIVSALKTAFSDKVKYIGLEYPANPVQYPAIFITYVEGPIQNVGVGHIEELEDDYGNTIVAKHSSFTGTVNFNVLGLSPVDRDEVASDLIALLQHGEVIPEYKVFKQELMDADYVSLHLMTDDIAAGGEQVGTLSFGGQDERQYGASYSVQLFGEFYSDAATGDLIRISKVHVWPYTDEPPVFNPPWDD
jgi:hypothetical protein